MLFRKTLPLFMFLGLSYLFYTHLDVRDNGLISLSFEPSGQLRVGSTETDLVQAIGLTQNIMTCGDFKVLLYPAGKVKLATRF